VRKPITLAADVVRTQTSAEGCAAIAIRFRDVHPQRQDTLQKVVLRELQRRSDPSILVIAGCVEELSRIWEHLSRLGYRVILGRTQLQAVNWMCNLDASIRVALAARDLHGRDGEETLTFIAENFSFVRRVLISDEANPERISRILRSGQAQAIVAERFTREDLIRAIGLEPSGAQRRARERAVPRRATSSKPEEHRSAIRSSAPP
jgi:hypothetical protein